VLTATCRREACRGFAELQTRVDERRRDAVVLQQPHLVMHQRDERRHDDRDAGLEYCRQLKTQRLAAAGRHDGQHIAAREGCANNRLLSRPKRVKAETTFQRAGEIGTRHH
jgi:hypothetical protein